MKQPTGVLIATILASSMVFIDGSVVNVILPVLQKAFHASSLQIQWVVQAYLLFLASLILIGGALGDQFGRKKIFTLGTLIFVGASIACGLSQSLLQLSLCRSIQGIGGALLTPGSLAIINSYFSPHERGKAIGTWSGYSALTAALGPVLGGFLNDHFSWRAVFFINAPFGALVLFYIAKYIPESKPEKKPHLDYPGALLSVLFVGILVYGLIEGNTFFVMVGIGLFIALVSVEAKVKAPLIPLEFFKSRVFSTINGLTFFLYASLSIVFYFLPFLFIQIQGFSTTEAGAANLPFVAIVFSASRYTGALYSKIGARLPITVGSLLVACGFLTLGFRADVTANYWADVLPGMVFFGMGMSLCISPLTTAVLAAVPNQFSGIASGINNSVSRIAGLVGVAALTLVMIHVFQNHLRELSIDESLKTQILAKAKDLAGIQGFDESTLKQVKSAYLASFRKIMEISASLAVVSAGLAGALLEDQAQGKKDFAN